MTGLLDILVAVVFVETLFAVAGNRTIARYEPSSTRRRIAVVIPAHNESAGLLPTLCDIKQQLLPGDRYVVVADNCSDDTATLAERAGAEVAVRGDPDRVGKGYALDFGVRYLSANPPEIVVVIDADCRLAPGALQELARCCAATSRPAQALYLMHAPQPSTVKLRVAEFAWTLKNWVRPLGLARAGLPCQLMGTGMAFPWPLISSVNLANAGIVEDLQLGIDLAVAGNAPLFCPSARVSSQFPTSQAALGSQRQRWEQGHFGLIKSVPRLLWMSVKKQNADLFAMAIDLAVPPIVSLTLLLAATTLIAGMAAFIGASPLAFYMGAVGCILIAATIALAWWRYGRSILPASAFIDIVPYVLGKLWLYTRLLAGRRQSRWIKTERD